MRVSLLHNLFTDASPICLPLMWLSENWKLLYHAAQAECRSNIPGILHVVTVDSDIVVLFRPNCQRFSVVFCFKWQFKLDRKHELGEEQLTCHSSVHWLRRCSESLLIFSYLAGIHEKKKTFMVCLYSLVVQSQVICVILLCETEGQQAMLFKFCTLFFSKY